MPQQWKGLAPHLSPVQRAASEKSYAPVPKRCVVTGGTGIVGMRLVEMLVERGAERVVAFDVVPKEKIRFTWNHPAIVYMTGDISNLIDVERAIEGADCVWHLAAAVGPFHPQSLYDRVNRQGTENVISAMKKFGVKKLIYSSSPSTRFRGSLFKAPNVDGVTEEQMPKLPLQKYMQEYARTKALGEMAVNAEVRRNPEFWATSIAPHQVYGPRDNLFLPNMLEAAGSGKLRVFGPGTNRICMTHVDNYAHALIIGEQKLFKGSPVLGKFYIATDGSTHPEPDAYCIFWKELDKAVVGMGFPSLWSKFKLPFPLLYCIALVCDFVGWIVGTTFKLNVFNVFVLTMHRWFDISAIEKDFGYQPIIPFELGWKDTIAWFKANWLPGYLTSADRHSIRGIATMSQAKIDIQAATEGMKKTI
jgi:nucleoside-diphosphate-sugar epimerase